MRIESDQPPVLEALRSHVALASDVSEAIDMLGERETESLSAVLDEAHDLVGRLAPQNDGAHQSHLELEGWLSAVLRGPHDARWFDERVRSRIGGWSNLPPVTCILVIGRVRHRLTEIATTTSVRLKPERERITDALARLFDLEVALLSLNRQVPETNTSPTVPVDPLLSMPKEAGARLLNALGVIETSAYLVRRYSEQVAPGNADIERHLDRISRHVQTTYVEIGRLAATRIRDKLSD